ASREPRPPAACWPQTASLKPAQANFRSTGSRGACEGPPPGCRQSSLTPGGDRRPKQWTSTSSCSPRRYWSSRSPARLSLRDLEQEQPRRTLSLASSYLRTFLGVSLRARRPEYAPCHLPNAVG